MWKAGLKVYSLRVGLFPLEWLWKVTQGDSGRDVTAHSQDILMPTPQTYILRPLLKLLCSQERRQAVPATDT